MTNWDKIFAIHIPDKQLPPLQRTPKWKKGKIKCPIEVALKHMKRHSTPLIIR